MNRIEATISAIHAQDRLHIVEYDACGIPLLMMALELPETLSIGSRVILGCKPSHVIVARGFSGEISLSNRIPVTIEKLGNGALLATLFLKSDCGEFESLITRNSSDRMGLAEGMEVTALIKASELSILEVLA